MRSRFIERALCFGPSPGFADSRVATNAANKRAAFLGPVRDGRPRSAQRARTVPVKLRMLALLALCPSRLSSFVQPFRRAGADDRASISELAIGPY